MKRLDQIASQFGKACDALEKGDGRSAAAELSELADQLDQLQSEMGQLETLDQLMDEIAAAKDAMGCSECMGEGCTACEPPRFAGLFLSKYWRRGNGVMGVAVCIFLESSRPRPPI